MEERRLEEIWGRVVGGAGRSWMWWSSWRELIATDVSAGWEAMMAEMPYMIDCTEIGGKCN